MDEHRYVCQQCKQPIVIDSSLVDLAPSAYDIIQSSLPTRNNAGSSTRHTTANELLDRVPASNAAKEIWKRAQMNKQQQPEQSFVLLQDSVLKDLPPASPPGKSVPPATPKTPKTAQSTATTSSSQNPKPTSLSHQIKSHSKLFALLSSHTDVDHPLCEECSHVLMTALAKQLEETRRERDGYLAFEREIRKERERPRPGEEDIDAKIE